MKTGPKSGHKPTGLSDNALAKQALQNIAAIDKDAQQKKLAQVESLNSAKATIAERMNELTHQLKQIDSAITAVTGRPASPKERQPRRDWTEERERIGRWLQGRKGEKFAAGDLVREFPEIDGQVVSLFLKPLVLAGTVKTDAANGPRRLKYFAEA